MRIRKIVDPGVIHNPPSDFENCVALDWAETSVAVAHMMPGDLRPLVKEYAADIQRVIHFLKGLQGSIILTFEESTPAHWLYGKCMPYVDRLIVCDPTYNRLLCRGPKNDVIDAAKLCLLLRQGSLKEVYHSTSKLYQLRLLVSTYEDTICAGVACQNRLKARLRGRLTEGATAELIVRQLQESIALYRKTKEELEHEFQHWARRTPQVRALVKVPGIGVRSAAKIVGTVIDARRFPNRWHYDSYCGLVWHHKHSGGNSYGRRRPAYSRVLKAVYKTAALAAIHGHNEFADYYQRLCQRGIAVHNARHATARHIAHISYGILRNGTAYDPHYVTDGEHNNS